MLLVSFCQDIAVFGLADIRMRILCQPDLLQLGLLHWDFGTIPGISVRLCRLCGTFSGQGYLVSASFMVAECLPCAQIPLAIFASFSSIGGPSSSSNLSCSPQTGPLGHLLVAQPRVLYIRAERWLLCSPESGTFSSLPISGYFWCCHGHCHWPISYRCP